MSQPPRMGYNKKLNTDPINDFDVLAGISTQKGKENYDELHRTYNF